MKYTVVLLRPKYITASTGEVFGQDIYVAFVEAATPEAALLKAQAEVFEADTENWLRPRKAEDYKLCVMFEGHHKPKRFGWQMF